MRFASKDDNSNSNKEDSNFNLLPQNSTSNDMQLSNCISLINNSPDPNTNININNNYLHNIEEPKNNINNFYNINSNNANYKNNENEIKTFENDSSINFNNDKNNESVIDDGQLIIDSINYGYIPFFIKIEDDKPLYFIAHKKTIFKNILYRRINTNKNLNNYNFYNNGAIIDKNVPLEDLNIKPLSIIIGAKEKKIA